MRTRGLGRAGARFRDSGVPDRASAFAHIRASRNRRRGRPRTSAFVTPIEFGGAYGFNGSRSSGARVSSERHRRSLGRSLLAQSRCHYTQPMPLAAARACLCKVARPGATARSCLSSAPGARSAVAVAVARVGEATVLISARSEAGHAGANLLVRPQMQGWPVERRSLTSWRSRSGGGVPDECGMTAGSPIDQCSGARLD
jgi:hypothetical protein